MINKNPQPPLAAIERKFSVFPALDHEIESTESRENKQDNPTKKIPNAIKSLIKRRCDTLKHVFNPSPCTGQIVLIQPHVITQQNPCDDFHLNEPLLVLLDTLDTNRSLCKGWLVTQEMDYASDWDVCLDPVLDAPLDPLIGMVQVWNRVTFHYDFIGRTVGELNHQRLADINAMAQDYQQHEQQIEDKRKPLIEFAKDDPRHRYQALYKQAATCLSDAATATIREEEPAHLSLNRWLQPLFLQVEAIKRSIVPRINTAMGDGNDEDNDLLINKSLRIQACKKRIKGGKGYLIKMSLRLEDEQQYSIEFFEDEYLEHYFELSVSKPQTHFLRNPESDESQLVIRDKDDNIVHIFSL